MKQELIRNLKFWGIQAQKTVLMMLAFGLGYTILFDKLMGQDLNYMILMSVVCCFILPVSTLNAYLPMLISFGSRRAESALGVQVMHIFMIVELLVANGIYLLVFKEYDMFGDNTMLLLLILMLLCVGLGQLTSCVSLKFGMKVTVIFIVVCSILAVFGMIAGIITGFCGTAFFLLSKSLILVAAIVLYLVSIWVLVLVMKKFEVKNVG